VGPRAGLDGCRKSGPPTGILSPDRPARSESLYRLSYPGRTCKVHLLISEMSFVKSLSRKFIAYINLSLQGQTDKFCSKHLTDTNT
jgi:hypothetical protein